MAYWLSELGSWYRSPAPPMKDACERSHQPESDCSPGTDCWSTCSLRTGAPARVIFLSSLMAERKGMPPME